MILKNRFIKKKKTATSKVTSKLRNNTIEEIQEGAIYASVAPCNQNLLKEWKCQSCLLVPNNVFVTSFYSHKMEVFAILVKDEQENIFRLIFRGSTTLTNQFMNYLFQSTPLDSNSPSLKVHLGYKMSIDSVSQNIISKLADLYKQEQYKNYKLKLYGHSLGGALASLMILDIQSKLQLNEDKLYLFTYGQPRVGNYEFVQNFNSHQFHSSRVANYYDEVPRFPSYIVYNYIHFNNEIFIDKDGNAIQCDSSYFEDPDCSQKVSIAYLSRDTHKEYFINFNHRNVC
ncbi:alpha/beta-hydrolase [Neoconidiobolus thromboides FSU 785]|nr:alpha/beta-hydrolase [Neoconidiobolus thromboides FSU 785]